MSNWLLDWIWLSKLWYQLLGSEAIMIVFVCIKQLIRTYEMIWVQRKWVANFVNTIKGKYRLINNCFSLSQKIYIKAKDYNASLQSKLPLSLIHQSWLHKMKGLNWGGELTQNESSITVQNTVIFIGKPNYWWASADVTMIVTSNDLTNYKHCSIQTTDIQHLIISIMQSRDNYCFTFHCCSLSTDVELQCFLQRWSVFKWAVLESSAVLRK